MKRTLLLLFIIPFFVSCGDEAIDIFDTKTKKFAESEGTISLEEFTELQQLIEKNAGEPGFEKFYSREKIDNTVLRNYLEKEKRYIVEKSYDPKKDAVTIYIENSLSMHGYINNNGSGFKNAIAQVFSVSEGFNGFTSYYINADTIPVNLTTENIVDINVAAFTKGNVKSSDLDNIFKSILSIKDKNTISILVSDCIYSIEKGDATDLLKRQALLTQRTFENTIKKNGSVTTLILKLESDFAGTYFDKRDHAYPNVTLKRPYYVIIMGDDNAVSYFKSKIDLATLDGYKNTYTINSKDYLEKVYHTVVSTKKTNSTFRPIDEFSDGKSIKGIEDISVDEGDFMFTVAVDFSKIPVDDAYIKDKGHYSITNGDYKIESIVDYNPNNVETRDANIIKQSGTVPTHLITFKATSRNYESLKFTLNRSTPQWIKDTGIEDDTDITKIDGKTFGFSYLVNGIEKAYTSQNGTAPYFEILITINN